jgi:hypothetical protein
MDNKKLSLPERTPGNHVWSSIEQRLIDATLSQQLRQHHPKPDIWNLIEKELENSSPLNQLPTHVPPQELWAKIEEQQPKTRRIVILNWMRIAASVIVVLGLAYTFQQMNSKSDTTSDLVYTEVWINPIQVENWDVETDRNIEILLESKEAESPLLLKSEEYLELKTEFENLVQSKEIILQELTAYNDNVELELLLTKIELEKNSLVRNLISFSHV